MRRPCRLPCHNGKSAKHGAYLAKPTTGLRSPLATSSGAGSLLYPEANAASPSRAASTKSFVVFPWEAGPRIHDRLQFLRIDLARLVIFVGSPKGSQFANATSYCFTAAALATRIATQNVLCGRVWCRNHTNLCIAQAVIRLFHDP